MTEEHRGWYIRKIPHFDAGDIAQIITYRLADSLPISKLKMMEEELSRLAKDKKDIVLTKRIEHWLDKGTGKCWLNDPYIAGIIQKNWLHFNNNKYVLHAWCIMPNHVHVLCTLMQGNPLQKVIHSWKSYTSKEANIYLNITGSFWQEGYFDRYIRSKDHYIYAINYIENNPVKANLCVLKEQWRFSSAFLTTSTGEPPVPP